MLYRYLFLAICLAAAISIPAAAIGGGEGWIQINCNVDGASVSFDGQYKGVITGGSLTVAVYTTGAPYSSFTVEKSGYTTYTGSLSMPAEGSTNVYTATLNKIAPSYGSIYVDSSPSSAQVYFNGNYRGTTPMTITDVYPGSYSIRVEKAGYDTFTTSVSVSSGLQSNVFAQLSSSPVTGSLYILSSPSGSSVFLDNIYRGLTPVTIKNLAAGSHTLQLDHANYYDWTSTVTVPAGGTQTIQATLNPLPSSTVGWLYIASSPGGASVTLDGSSVGQTPASGSLRLNIIAAGSHTVSLTLAGYQPYTTAVTVNSNTVSEVSAILQPVSAPSGTGELTVSSTPAGANVFLDNAFIGVTPVTIPGVAAGLHTVTIRLDGYSEYTAQAQVNHGATSTVSAALSPATPTKSHGSGILFPAGACAALLIAGVVALRKCRSL